MTASSSSILQGVLILALFCWILSKRFQWRPVRGDSRQWRLPLILIAIGVWATLGSQHKTSSGAVIANSAARGYIELDASTGRRIVLILH